MSDLRNIPDHDPAWLSIEECKARGLVVTLMEDHLGNAEPPLHRATARAVEAALVVSVDRPMPGILLQDGTVLVLGWEQSFALVDALNEFRRLVNPVERDALGPTRATVELPA